jgi:hypothetical protein
MASVINTTSSLHYTPGGFVLCSFTPLISQKPFQSEIEHLNNSLEVQVSSHTLSENQELEFVSAQVKRALLISPFFTWMKRFTQETDPSLNIRFFLHIRLFADSYDVTAIAALLQHQLSQISYANCIMDSEGIFRLQ